MISKRIKELASIIPDAKRIIDVGCDHALLDIYLASKKSETKFLATDISKNALESAKKNISDNHLENRIETLLTDGLNNITLNKEDLIVISGMGTNTIIDIISKRLEEINNIIIQSNRDLETLRNFMVKNNFKILDEKVIFDDYYYVFIRFSKGKQEYSSEDFWLGPIIKNSSNIEYFKFLLKRYQKILFEIPDHNLKKETIENRINFLRKLIEKK